MTCSAFDFVGCGSLSLDVSDLEFMDSSGNVLSGVSLEPVPGVSSVPEVSSWLLLATSAAPVIFWRRSRSKRVFTHTRLLSGFLLIQPIVLPARDAAK